VPILEKLSLKKLRGFSTASQQHEESRPEEKDKYFLSFLKLRFLVDSKNANEQVFTNL